MRTSPQGVAEIASHEAIVLSPYRDSRGILTIGVGHTKGAGAPDPASFPVGVEQPIDRILAVFRADLAKFEDRVNQAVKVPVAQHEFDALVSFDFNTGGIDKANLVKKLNAGDRAGAIKGFDGWHKPPEIIGRRNKEKALFASGTYASVGKATVYPADANGKVLWSKGRKVDVLSLMGIAPPTTDPPFSLPPSPEPIQPAPEAGFFMRLFELLFGWLRGRRAGK